MKNLKETKWVKPICMVLFFFTFSSGMESFAQCGYTAYGGDWYYSTTRYDRQILIPRYNDKVLFIGQNGIGSPITFIDLGSKTCGAKPLQCESYSINPYYSMNNAGTNSALTFSPFMQNLGITKISVFFTYSGVTGCWTNGSSGTDLAYEFNVTVEQPSLNLTETNKIATICNNTNDINLNNYAKAGIANIEYQLDGVLLNPLITVDEPPYWVEEPCDPNDPMPYEPYKSDGTASILPPTGCGYYYDPPPYSYRNAPIIKLANLSLGLHTVTASKQYNNGTWSESFTMNKVQPPPVPVNTIVSHPKCSGELGSILLNNFINSDGSSYAGGQNLSLILTAQNSTIPLAAIPFTGTSLNVPDLPSGTWTATINDEALTCTSALPSFTVNTAPLPISASIMGTNPDCSTGTGTITASATGGTPPYQYSLNGGNFQPGNVFTGITEGSYSVVVKDANGCISSVSNSVSITIPTPINFTLSSTNLTAYQSGNGTIEISASGGKGAYQYRLNSGIWQSDNTFTNLAAGTYQAEVSTSNTCISSPQTVILSQPPPLVLNLVAKQDLSCSQAGNGMIEVSGQGGNTGYQYSIDGINYQLSGKFSGLSGGSYTLSVQDALGYTSFQTIQLTEPQPLSLGYTTINPVCYNDNTGEITLNVTGGTQPYSYSWLNNPLTGNTAKAGNLAGGTYQVLITDANNCSIQQPIELINPQQIQADAIQDAILCTGQQITYDAGNSGSSYEWSADNGFSSAQKIVTLEKAGKYKLSITNAANCSLTKTFTIGISNALLKADFLLPSFVNAGDTAIVIDVSKPTPIHINWTLTGGTVAASNATNSIQQITFTDPGTYNITMNVSLGGGCADVIQKTITVLPKGQTKEVETALGYQPELLKLFKIYPNPNSGSFKAEVQLSDKAKIKLRLISFATNQLIETKQEQGKTEYTLEFDHPELLPGMYILTLETGNIVKSVKIIKL